MVTTDKIISRNNPKDQTLYFHRRENLKSYAFFGTEYNYGGVL
jgi:hypothetical protein